MTNRLGIDVTGTPGPISFVPVFNVGIGTIAEGPTLSVGVTCAVLKDLRTVCVQESGLRELFKALHDAVEGIIGQLIIMVQFHEQVALPEATSPVLQLTYDS